MTDADIVLDKQRCGAAGCDCARGNVTHCALHRPDEKPSMSVAMKGDKLMVHCLTGCSQAEVFAAAVALLPARNGNQRTAKPQTTNGTSPSEAAPASLRELAAMKHLDVEYLVAQGCTDVASPWAHVEIPWLGPEGEVVAIQNRPGKQGKRFQFQAGGHPQLYGIHKLEKMRARGWVLLVEGASDCWTAWSRGIPALGLPSLSGSEKVDPALLTGLEVFVWQEPEAATETLVRKLAAKLPGLRVIKAPPAHKDLSAAHIAGDDVRDLVASLKASAPLAVASAAPTVSQATAEVRPLGEVLEDVERFITRFVFFDSKAQVVAVVLWVAHTHVLDSADTSPYLAITSAEKRSGKSRLLEILRLLVKDPWQVTLPSEAVVFRKIQRDHPTLLLDEVDAIFSKKAGGNTEGLRALLNAGNRKGTTVPRVAGEGKRMTLEEFEVYCPKALAGIGKLPDTVTDRSIPIRLLRRRRDEPVERFRHREVKGEAEELEAALVRAMELDLSSARPQIPDALNDRAADGWEPLLAIADAAAGAWPERARRSAITLSASSEADEQSLGVRLLDDLRTVLREIADDSISTTELIEKLRNEDEWPWVEVDLKPVKLARLLKPYGVRPTSVRRPGSATTVKGYHRDVLTTAFGRWLDPPTDPLHEGGSNGTAEQRPQSEYPSPNTKQPQSSGVPFQGVLREDGVDDAAAKKTSATVTFERIGMPPLVINLDDPETGA